ncbi:MAG TPA: hypothetical protein VFS90_17695 [Pyrinomonadaceae bacterium]|nr:hypothetical protein [Pyrinomonadaceae bacterium]
MKALLLTAVVLGAAISPVVAQKKSTFMGDIVIGELAGRDDATREITIKYPGKEGPEIFSGILADNYRLRREDGRPIGLTLNEILPGMHIRVFYKKDHEKVSGQEKQVNKIVRLDFLGKDKYDRLRNQLNIDPTTPVAAAEKDELPAGSTLKIYPAFVYSNVRESFVESINEWTRKNGDLYGKLEVVSDLAQADISMVVARGADTMVAALPADFSDNTRGAWVQTTSYLVIKDPAGLKVVWTRVVPVLSYSDTAASPRSFEVLMPELGKRMKARTRNQKQ